jgi:hypothetical protein
VRTAVKGAVRLDAVADDLATAVVADRRELVDRALEAVEDVVVARGDDLKRQVVVIAAYLTLGHGETSWDESDTCCETCRMAILQNAV